MTRNADKQASPRPDKENGPSRNWLDWLDVTAKLIGALAVALITWVGYTYQSNSSITSLINQREQAESQLRASMLHDLIEPIIGRDTSIESMDLGRGRLLVELVTLNFHDHFEFKPLLEEVDKRLAAKGDEEGRERLGSVARRVIDRQINMLKAIEETTQNKYRAESSQFVFTESAAANPQPEDRCLTEASSDNPGNLKQLFERPLCVASPDKKFCLEIVLYQPEFEQRVISATINVYADPLGCDQLRRSGPGKSKKMLTISDLKVSAFDFPLTDNTQIDPDHRFALSLYYMKKEEPMLLKLLWFPEGYITERERPINYLEMRKLLKE
jgi:hypothetical protein